MKYIIWFCLAFLLGAAFANQRAGASPKRAMPLVCVWQPEVSPTPDRCWDGERTRYLMPGYKVFVMEGGQYLVGWPK